MVTPQITFLKVCCIKLYQRPVLKGSFLIFFSANTDGDPRQKVKSWQVCLCSRSVIDPFRGIVAPFMKYIKLTEWMKTPESYSKYLNLKQDKNCNRIGVHLAMREFFLIG